MASRRRFVGGAQSCRTSKNVPTKSNSRSNSNMPRSGVVAGGQASRSPKSILRGCPQIVHAGGVERRLAPSQQGSNVITNSGQRAVGVVQDLGRRPTVGGSVAVVREVGRRGFFTEVDELELLAVALRVTHHESGPVDDDGEIHVAVRPCRSPGLGTEEQNSSRGGISRQFIHESCDCRVHRVMPSNCGGVAGAVLHHWRRSGDELADDELGVATMVEDCGRSMSKNRLLVRRTCDQQFPKNHKE